MAFLWPSEHWHLPKVGMVILKGRIFITWLGERPSFSPTIVNKKYVVPVAVYIQIGWGGGGGSLMTKATEGGQNRGT